jgi:hypothetical protein
MGIKNTSQLKSAIVELEKIRTNKKLDLEVRLHQTFESLKPRNILYNAVGNFIALSNLEKLTASFSFIAPVILSSKFVGGPYFKLIRKISGTIFGTSIKKIAVQYSNEIKNGSVDLFKRLFNKFTL